MARHAADWVQSFYPDISVILNRETAQLASHEHDETALRLIWRSAVVNEALHARGASHRAAVIEALVQ